MSETKTVLARITGRVQGVGFRAWTEDEARLLGLDGWVRNERDGSVTALLSGSEGAVGALVERLRRGPPGSRVDDVAVERSDEQVGRGFRITG